MTEDTMDKQREKLIGVLAYAASDAYSIDTKKDVEELADFILADEEIKHAFELLKAEKEGRLIVTPCKVGDTVYRIAKLFTQTIIVEGEAYGFSITHEFGSNSKYLLCFFAKGKEFERTNYSTWFDFSDFGKTVFLSREDAEKALKGVE